MTFVDELIARNAEFSRKTDAAGRLMPQLKAAVATTRAIIICCGDMRVDPADVLGLVLGESLLLRNIGGRVTPGVQSELQMLGKISAALGQAPGGTAEFNLIVLQHTDCGILRLQESPSTLAGFFQFEEAALAAKTVGDPRAAVVGDIAVLRSMQKLPSTWVVSGLVYDVTTGLIEVVVPAAPLRS